MLTSTYIVLQVCYKVKCYLVEGGEKMGFRSARLKSGKSVVEVMKHMNVTDAAVYQWETGVTKPRIEKLMQLAEFYGCTIEDLLKDD